MLLGRQFVIGADFSSGYQYGCNICMNSQHVSPCVAAVQRLMRHWIGKRLFGFFEGGRGGIFGGRKLPNAMNSYKTP